MPIYAYKCNECNDLEFEIFASMKDDHSSALCPECKKTTQKRIFHPVSSHIGMTLMEKTTGVSKKRIEASKHMRDQRVKRKREHGPGTKHGDSNELWSGAENEKKIL